MAEDFRIGAAFVELYLKDPTEADEARARKAIETRLTKTPPRVAIKLAATTAESVSAWRKDTAKKLAEDRPEVAVQVTGPSTVDARKVRSEIADKVSEPPVTLPVKVTADRKSRTLTRGNLIKFAAETAAIVGPAGVIGGAVVGTAGLFGTLGIAAVHADTRVTTAFGHLKSTVVADTKALAAPIVPALTGVAHQTESTFQGMERDIGHSFAVVAPQITSLTGGVLDLAREALPGLTGALSASRPVVSTLSHDLGGLGHAVGGFLDGLSTGAPGAAEGIHAILTDVDSILPPLGQFIGSAGELTGIVLHDLTPAIKAGTTVLSGAATIIDHTSSVLGPLGAAALTTYAAFKLWKGITGITARAGAGIAGVTGVLRKEAVSATEATVANTGYSRSIKGIAGTAEGTAGKVGLLAGRLGKLGSAAGAIGVGVAVGLPALSALADKLDHTDEDTARFTKSLLAGGDAARGIIPDFTKAAKVAQLFGDDNTFADKEIRKVKDGIDAQLKSLGANKESVDAVNAAYGRFVQVAGNTKSSRKDIEDALAGVGSAMDDADGDTQRLNDQLRQLHDHLRDVASSSQAAAGELSRQQTVADGFASDISLRQAVDATTQSQRNYAQAVKDSGAGSADAKQAADELLSSMQAQAQAASQAAQANYTGTDAAGKAAAGAAAYRDTLVALSQHASGPLKDALLGTIKRLDDAAKPRVTDLKADISNAEAGIKTAEDKLKTIPKSKQAKILADISDLEAKAAKARAELKSIQSKTVRIGANLVVTGPSSIQIGSVVTGIKAFAEGGVIPPVKGGQVIKVAEAGVPEVVIPLNRQGERFVRQSFGVPTPRGATATASTVAGAAPAPVQHIHIGSVVLNVSPAELKDAAALVAMLKSLPQVARAGGAGR